HGAVISVGHGYAGFQSMPSCKGARRSVRLWIYAAFAAVALHTGALALVVLVAQPEDAPDELGTNAIEVGYVRLAPKVESVELPAGPDSDPTAASAAVEEQKEVVKDTNLPRAMPTETEDPDRVVTPNDKKKPVEDERVAAKSQTRASAAATATEASATPSSQNSVVSTRSVAP